MKIQIYVMLSCLVAGHVIGAGAEVPGAEIAPTPTEVTTPAVPVSDKPFAQWLGGNMPTQLLRVMPGETPTHLRYAPEYIDQYEVIGTGPVEIPPTARETLKETLANSSGFGALRTDRCKFHPGLSLRAGAGKDQIDLLVCFACDEIGIVPGGQPLQVLYSFDQPTRDVLLNMAKSLLPQDEVIQELPGVRRDKTASPLPAPRLPEPSKSDDGTE